VRVVADTNTIVSGLLWKAAPRALLDAARDGQIALYTSAALLAELALVLPRAKFAKRVAASGMSTERLVRRYATLARRIVPADINPVVIADADDDAVLACALAANAEIIVSGDAHLRNLKTWHGIRILSTTATIALIART